MQDAAGTDAEDMTLQRLLDRVEAVRWKGSKAEETSVANAQRVVNLLGPDRLVRTIKAHDIDDLIVRLQEGRSGATVNRHLSALGTMLRYAHKVGWIGAVPPIAKRRESEHRIRFYTSDEEARILAWLRWAGHDEAHRLVVVLLDTGLRRGEALRLRYADVGPGSSVTVWQSKSGKPRTVPLTKRAAEAVGSGEREALVFPTLTLNRIEKIWSKAREAVGLGDDEQAVLHACRHTFASRLIQRGVSIPVVQRLLGHASITMTMRYAHLAPADLTQAVAVLENNHAAT